jgi:hypothetical protein
MTNTGISIPVSGSDWIVVGPPNSERPQHDRAHERDNREHQQDIELQG